MLLYIVSFRGCSYGCRLAWDDSFNKVLITALIRAFFKKLQLLGLSLNEGLFPTQFIRVHKNHSVLRERQRYLNMGWVGLSEILSTKFKRLVVFLFIQVELDNLPTT
jgi:hypothetical protein